MTTTHAALTRPERPRARLWLVAAIAVAAILVAAIVGYAIAGGFTSTTTPGQSVSDKVMNAWATGDEASIAATYAPSVKGALVYDHTQDVFAADRASLVETISGAIAIGNTYKQIGPVATYQATNGDLYVATLVEVRGPGHPSGIPVVGFYRVRGGFVIRHIFLDAEHY